MKPSIKRAVLYGSGLAVLAAVYLLSDTPLLRPFTERRSPAQREESANRAARKAEADWAILILGNSHVQAGDPTLRLQEMFEVDGRGESAFIEVVAYGNAHLDDHLRSEQSLKYVDEGDWDVIVLQGIKYSTSGRFNYPTDDAVALGRRAKKNARRVILFPEWGQRGNVGETERVHDLLVSLAPQMDAEVAPVGRAWDAALAARPDLSLHQDDGNHATFVGAHLTACVLYAAIANRSPQGLTTTRRPIVPDETLVFLQEIASDVTGRETRGTSH